MCLPVRFRFLMFSDFSHGGWFPLPFVFTSAGVSAVGNPCGSDCPMEPPLSLMLKNGESRVDFAVVVPGAEVRAGSHGPGEVWFVGSRLGVGAGWSPDGAAPGAVG